MAHRSTSPLSAFAERLDLTNVPHALLKMALTHKSSQSDSSVMFSYERLEFLGDRVLGLVISEALYRRFTTADEGVLARKLTFLVRRETCAEIARQWQLQDVIIFQGHSKRSAKSHHDFITDNVLADVAESLLGALFLSCGYDVVRGFILHHWAAHLETVDELTLQSLKDPKSALQELCQHRGFGLPVYQIINRNGPDHAPVFIVEVIAHEHISAQGTGSSKRDAEQNAAQACLDILEGLPV